MSDGDDIKLGASTGLRGDRPGGGPRLLSPLDSIQMMLRTLIALASAYLIGSVDFAVLVGKAKGIDIYSVGSGNPGTSNVLRTMGKGAAVMVLLGDLAKGLVASAIGFLLAGPDAVGALAPQALAALAGFFAVLGHCYPVFHRFHGGKGMATGAGVLLFAEPFAGLILAAVWGIVVGVTRTASVGSLLVVVLAIPTLWFLGASGWTMIWVGITLALIVYRHKGNISRLLAGRERKVVAS